MADLSNLNKLFVRVTNKDLRDEVIAKSKETKNNKIYFLAPTNEIITQGVAYGLSTSVAEEIAKLKSIAATYFADGKEDAIKSAIDAVQKALKDYKADNEAKRTVLVKTVAYNADKKAIEFTSEDGKTVQSIKAADIIGNHVVKSSNYDADTNKLTLVFAGAENDVSVDIDLSSIYDLNDITTDDAVHFKAAYTAAVKDKGGHVTKGGSLVIAPIITKVADAKAAVTEGENQAAAVTGLVDALDVKTYIDAAVSGAQGNLQAKIDTINGKLDTIQGDENTEGSINKALKDAKEYADGKVAQEAKDRRAAINSIYGGDPGQTPASTISGNATNIASLATALENEVTARKEADTKESEARTTDIKAITDALADPATFWEDYTTETPQA